MSDQKLYTILPHQLHNRLYHIHLHNQAVNQFLEATTEATQQLLTYVPYMRLIVADALQKAVGKEFAKHVNRIVRDRATGGFTLSGDRVFENIDQQVAFGTAVAHLIGIPNFDDMTNNFYACFEVKDTDTSDSYLRQAYRLFTLHTDGTYVEEPTDWILMMKMSECFARGGESRVLHLDDWDDLDRFARHFFGAKKFAYKSPPSKNYPQTMHKSTFDEQDGRPCMCFIDQFVYPETIEEACYLKDMSASMEASNGVVELHLPVHQMVVLNNHFWLHGRAPFEKHPNLSRVLMRQRGYFRREGGGENIAS